MIRSEVILQKLDEIEREMRNTSFWDDSLNVDEVRDGAARVVAEQGKSPVGTMPFEHWLQAVFIPNARGAAQTGNLPFSSQVSLMAMREYDYHSHIPEAQELLKLLREFDALFS
jgi:uncharacterized protein YqcC (DUF446 family)